MLAIYAELLGSNPLGLTHVGDIARIVYYFQQWFAWLTFNFYDEMKMHVQHHKIISEMYSVVKQHILTSLVSSTLALLLHKSLVLIKSQYIICCNKSFRTTLAVQAVLQQLYDVL